MAAFGLALLLATVTAGASGQRSIRGVLVDAAGRPVVGASIELEPRTSSAARQRVELGIGTVELVARTRSDAAGRFDLVASGLNRYTLRVRPSGRREAPPENSVETPAETPVESVLEISPGRADLDLGRMEVPDGERFEVTVRTERGEAVRHARVALEPVLGPVLDSGAAAAHRLRPARSLARTDNAGRAVMARATGLGHTLHVVGPGLLARSSTVRATDRQQTVTLEGGLDAGGLVVDTEERPIEGAAVELRLRSPLELSADLSVTARRLFGRAPLVARALTDSTGHFVLRDLADPAAVPGYDLAVERDGFVAVEIPGVRLDRSEGETGRPIDLGTVVLDEGLSIRGTVVDDDATPVAGVTVSIDSASWVDPGSRIDPVLPGRPPAPEAADSVTTDEAGGFELRDLAVDRLVQVIVRHDGHRERAPIAVRPPLDEPLRIVLARAMTLTGTVLDHAGAPLSGARVFSAADLGRKGRSTQPNVSVRTTTTKEDGRFEVGELAAGNVELTVSGRGHRPLTRSVALDPDSPATEVVIRLERGADLELVVYDPEGRPVEAALVDVRPMGVILPPPTTGGGRTDGDGRFRSEGLEPGRHRVRVEHLDLLPATRELDLEVGETTLAIELDAGLSIAGKVLDLATGDPVSGARLAVIREGGNSFFRGPSVPHRSDADGRFEIRGLPEGTHRVSADAGERGFGVSAPVDLDADLAGSRRGVVVEIATDVALHGRVTGVAFDDLAGVLVRSLSQNHFFEVRPDFEGRFRFEAMPAGRVHVRASRARDGRSVSEQVILERGSDTEVLLDFGAAAGRLEGVVVFETGSPAAGAAVTIRRRRGGAVRTVTDQAGRYLFEDVDEGPAEIVASLAGAIAARSIEIAGETRVDLELVPSRIAGRVVDRATGEPLALVDVWAFPDPDSVEGYGREARRGRTGPDGFFSISVLDGAHALHARRDGFVPVNLPDLLVGAGVELHLDLELVPEAIPP